MKRAWLFALCILGCGGTPATDGGGGDSAAPADAAMASDAAVAPDAAMADAGGSSCAPCAANLMTDPMNCGACGHDCLGGQCAGGLCAPIALAMAMNGDSFGGVALDGNNVYWFAGGAQGQSASIYRIAKAGGAVSTVATGKWAPLAIVTDGKDVFWNSTGTPGQLLSAPAGGGPAKVLNAMLDLADNAAGLALDANSVYVGAKQDVKQVPKLGGNAIGLGTTFDGAGAAVAIDNTGIYWVGFADAPKGAVYQQQNGAPPAKHLADGLALPIGLALDGEGVVFLEELTAVKRVKKAGGAVTTLASGMDLDGAVALAVDDQAYYWLNKTTRVTELRKCGGAPFALTDKGGLYNLATDGKYVYFATEQALYKVPR